MLLSLLDVYPKNRVTVHAVNKKMNRLSVDDPSYVEPIKEKNVNVDRPWTHQTLLMGFEIESACPKKATQSVYERLRQGHHVL